VDLGLFTNTMQAHTSQPRDQVTSYTDFLRFPTLFNYLLPSCASKSLATPRRRYHVTVRSRVGLGFYAIDLLPVCTCPYHMQTKTSAVRHGLPVLDGAKAHDPFFQTPQKATPQPLLTIPNHMITHRFQINPEYVQPSILTRLAL
jgi:hypothetical protein